MFAIQLGTEMKKKEIILNIAVTLAILYFIYKGEFIIPLTYLCIFGLPSFLKSIRVQ